MKPIKFFSLLLLIFLFKTAYGGVTLYNDSPFVLNVTVLASDGTELLNTTIHPQNQYNMPTDFYASPAYSQTPYTVIWECKEGSEFGVWTNVSPGSWITAQGSSGTRYCKPTKKAPPAGS